MASNIATYQNKKSDAAVVLFMENQKGKETGEPLFGNKGWADISQQ